MLLKAFLEMCCEWDGLMMSDRIGWIGKDAVAFPGRGIGLSEYSGHVSATFQPRLLETIIIVE